MDWIRSQEEIESELFQIEQSFFNSMVSYDKAINYCQNVLEFYRAMVVAQGFPDEASEIQFFKKDKPFIYSLLLKYTHQLSFKLDYPNLAYGMNGNIIQRKIEEVNAFLSQHQDMVLYIELEVNALDSQYFLRKNRQFNACPSRYGHSFDSGFSTSHDGLIAQILGYQGFLVYLQNKLVMPRADSKDVTLAIPHIDWTESKVSLTELGFALYYSGAINHGNTSLKSVMNFLEQVTDIDLGDYHHTSIRLRNRSNPTKFIDKLRNSLQNWITNLDA